MSERQAQRIKKLEAMLRKERAKVKTLEKQWNTTGQTLEASALSTDCGQTSQPSNDRSVMKLIGFAESWYK